MRILFLDVDGVLNAHDRYANGHCGLHADKLALLDGIVARTGCKIVLSSAWRYMVLNGAMSLNGFAYMLMINGAAKATADAMWSYLPHDCDPSDIYDRAKLARAWLEARPEAAAYVALDDIDFGWASCGIPDVRPRHDVGMTPADADRVVEILNRQVATA